MYICYLLYREPLWSPRSARRVTQLSPGHSWSQWTCQGPPYSCFQAKRLYELSSAKFNCLYERDSGGPRIIN